MMKAGLAGRFVTICFRPLPRDMHETDTLLIAVHTQAIMTSSKALFVLALTAEVLGVGASWPFGQKRYTEEALIDAGSLGVEGVGRVVAVGDWNGDQQYVETRSDHERVVSDH